MADVIELMRGFVAAKAVHLAAELGIADLVHEGVDSTAAIAARAECDPDATGRLLRALCSVGVLSEVAAGRFRLTAAGEPLRSGTPDSLRDWVRLNGGPMFRAFADAEHSLRSGKPSFELAHGLPFFEYLEREKDSGATFNSAMQNFARQANQALSDAYDFADIDTLVDVGGGSGELLASVLRRHPAMRGVLFDQAHVIHDASSVMAEAGVSDRCTLASGSFFDVVVPGGDAYLLSWILHDWDDDDALRILRNVRAAMAPGALLLVFEAVLPDSDEPHFARLGDLVMLVALGGRERTRAGYEALLARAGFECRRVIATASPRSLMEAVAVDE